MIDDGVAAPDLLHLSAEGLRLLRAGHLTEAEALYRQILQFQPRHADSWHMLGMIASRAGRKESAVDLIRHAIALHCESALYFSNLGNALKDLGCLNESVLAYRAALCVKPDYPEAHSNLATAVMAAGRPSEAVAGCGTALRLKPDLVEAHYNRARALIALSRLPSAVVEFRMALCIRPTLLEAYYQLGNTLQASARLTEAAAAYLAALRLKPDYAEAHANRGTALNDLGRLIEAGAAYHVALSLKPDLPEAYVSLATAMKGCGRPTDAVTACSAALRIKPDLAEAFSVMGSALRDLGRHGEALAAYRAALRFKPDYAEAYSNLGNTLRDLGRHREAVQAYHAALGFKPDYAEAHSNLGNALKELGCLTEAVAAYGAALRILPDYAEAHANLGQTHLLTGRFAEGWSENEWRWQTKEFADARNLFRQPWWQGEDLAGKTILLHAEQGLGDAIQFCRYVPLVSACGGRVILQLHRPLLRLVAGLPGVDRVVAAGDPLPEFDLHCALMSLPLRFGTTPHTVPPVVPFAADAARVAQWRERLRSPDRKIGIVWQGNPNYRGDRDRSVPLALFAPLAARAGVRLISLQKRHGLEQLGSLPEGMRVETLGADSRSRGGTGFDEGADAFIDTAAVMMSLDLIVSVDTATAHLAGTLGRPVWVPLATSPHWVWLLDRDDSPWYPTMRLFRQRLRGAWREPFDRMAMALDAMTGDGGHR